MLLFAPAIFTGRLLAPGDGLLQSVPALYSRLNLWTPFLFSGFPVAADPQSMTWYPLSWIFSWGFSSWNIFVVSGYVLASSFTYGYLWRLTRSSLAAWTGGIVFGMSGFLTSNLPAPNMVHSAAWLPLMVWSVEELRRRVDARWVALLALAVASSALAGHPQMFIYSLVLSGAYATVAMFRNSQPRSFAIACTAGMTLGIGLAAVLLLPMIELAQSSVRQEVSFEFFTSGALPLRQVPALLLPAIVDNLAIVPLHGYLGLPVLVLAGLSFSCRRAHRWVAFWTAVAALSFLLTLGASTPLARLAYLAPGYGAFRMPIRHFLEFSFSVAILAGLALSGLGAMDSTDRRRLVVRGISTALSLFILTTTVWMLVGQVRPTMEVAPAVLAQLGILIGALGTVILWSRRPTPFHGRLVVLLIVLDLGYASTISGLRDRLPRVAELSITESMASYRDELEETQQRLIALSGTAAPTEAGRPNLSYLWRIPSAGGYNPLILSRYSEFLRMTPDGQFAQGVMAPENTSLDLLGVRYLTSPVPGVPDRTTTSHGMVWPEDELGVTLGSGCGTQRPQTLELRLAEVVASRIGVVTSMACAAAIPNGAEVLRMTLAPSGNGPPEVFHLRAGFHTAEWAWERPDVRAMVAHDRAPIFETFSDMDDEGTGFNGLQYVSIMPIATNAPLANLRVEWVGPAGEINLIRLVLEDNTGSPYRINLADSYLLDGARWNQVADAATYSIFENLRAMPRVWLTPRARAMDRADVLRTVHQGVLPGGEAYDPWEVALVEEGVDFQTEGSGSVSSATIVESTPESVEIDVRTDTRALLILADAFYPGWVASIDGVETEVLRTNYVLRGVLVDAGEHTVVFAYRPLAFYYGATISGAALLAMALVLLRK